MFFLPSSGPPYAQGTLGVVVLGHRALWLEALTHWDPIGREPTYSTLSYWLEVRGSATPTSRRYSKGSTGSGGVRAGAAFLRTVGRDTAVRPWQSRSPCLAALPTRLPSLAARTRIPALRWGQNLFLPSRGLAWLGWGSRSGQITELSSGWIRTPLDSLCSFAHPGRAGVGWEEG